MPKSCEDFCEVLAKGCSQTITLEPAGLQPMPAQRLRIYIAHKNVVYSGAILSALKEGDSPAAVIIN